MGWARGFEAGSRVASSAIDTYRQAGLRRGLAQEARRFNVTEGAYGPDLQQNIQQVEQLRDQSLRDAAAQQASVEDLEAIRAQFDPSIAELQRRAGLTAPDFSIASGPQNFATREEADRAARPMRAEGLASVYERFGEVDRAEAMRERADAGRFREFQMRGLERTERQAAAIEAVDADTSKWMTSRLTNDDGTVRAPTTEDTIAGIQHRAALLQQKGLGDQAAAAMQQFTSIAANQIQLQTAERNQALASVAAGIASGDYAPVRDFYDRFIPDGAKVTDVKEGRDGRITISRRTLDGEKLPDTTFANRNEMLAALNSVRDPMSLYNYAQQEFQNTIALRNAAAAEARARQERDKYIQVEDAQGNLQVIDINRLPRGADGQPQMPEGFRRTGARAEKPLTPEQENAWKLAQKDDRFTRAANANDRPAMRAYLTARGIPLSVLPGLDEGPPGGGTMTPDAAPEADTDVASEAGIDTSRAPATRGQARLDARVRAELSREFEAQPEVQAMLRDLEESRAGLRRGGRTDTRELAAQIAQMREQYIAERMGAR